MEEDKLIFANRFSITSRWQAREETPEELGERTLRFLDAITPLHPAFHDWKFLDLSRSAEELAQMEEEGADFEEIFCPLEVARSRMTDIVVEWGMNRDDFDLPEPRGGYNVLAGNGFSDSPDSVALSVHGGGSLSWAGRLRKASFETDMTKEADPTIVAYPVFKSILMTLVLCWNVDHARAVSSDLTKLSTGGHYFCGPSWMVYLSAPLAHRITIPWDVTVERTPDGGILMIAAEETFDTNNPIHVARARSILAALEPLNAEEAAKSEQRNTWRPPKGGGAG